MNVNLVNSGRVTEAFAFEATSVAVQDRFAPALTAVAQQLQLQGVSGIYILYILSTMCACVRATLPITKMD